MNRYTSDSVAWTGNIIFVKLRQNLSAKHQNDILSIEQISIIIKFKNFIQSSFPSNMRSSKISCSYLLLSPLRSMKENLANFGPLTTKSLDVSFWPTQRSLCVVCRPARLHSGHVTLLGAEFQPLNCLSSRIYVAGRPHLGLCPKFVVELWFCR